MSESLAVSMMKAKASAEEAGEELHYQALEVLNDLDGMFVKQEWEILEQVTNWYEQKNEYTFFDKHGKVQLFKAREKTCCCWRLCCGENRGFRMKIYDSVGEKEHPALVIKRKYRCCGCAIIPCCAHRLDVHYMLDENNNTIGSESSQTLISSVQVPICHGGCCQPTWHINDRHGQTQSTIKGPCFCVSDTCGADFSIYDHGGKKTGGITKLAPKSLKQIGMELATDADTFQVKWDKNIPPALKMAIMAATLQIDFTFFEDQRGVCQGRLCDFWCCGWACPCVPALCCCCCKNTESKQKEANRGSPETQEMMR
mmetsp:Transcript_53560/g.117089  ORF Transcript_53560/g.117089 Transcript_53560/m.117089 type:complete len:313 (+) Transcript_53560:144-1082(+)